MAEFIEVMKQFNRMCDSHKRCGTCPTCPINHDKELFTCYRWLTKNAEKAEEIIMTWAEEHPLKTNRDKFKEIFGIDFSYLFRLGISRDLLNWLEKEYEEPKDE